MSATAHAPLLAVLLSISASAVACECPVTSMEQRLAEATTVFFGKTESAVRSRGKERDELVVSTTDRIYLKGSKSVVRAVTAYSGTECGASVSVPGLYFFLLDESGRFDKCGTLVSFDSKDAAVFNNKLRVELKRMRRAEVKALRRKNKMERFQP